MFRLSNIHVSVLSGKLWTSPRTGKQPNHLEIADHTLTVRSATVKFIWMMGFRAGRSSLLRATSIPPTGVPDDIADVIGSDLFDLPGILLSEEEGRS